MSLNNTPSANRLHIGIFGKVNTGKSTLINAFTGQDVSIVSDIAGTTTDVVTKAMEIAPLGPCVLIDTAGFDDTTMLGAARKEKTRLAAEKCDIAVLLFSETSFNAMTEDDLSYEKEWYSYFVQNKIPVLAVVNKTDSSVENKDAENVDAENSQVNNNLIEEIKKITKEEPVIINAKSGTGIDSLKEALIRKIPEDFETGFITGNLIKEDDVVMLVMPQDAQAPKGRLILPQVQTIRELLDRKCVVMSVTPEKMPQALEQLKNPPKLIITDSQVFKTVYELKPEGSMLTSFSVLFAGYKGDLPYYIEGAKAIERLSENSKVLIAECCTHAPLSEDIGKVKIPNMLRKRFGEGLSVDVVSGTDFPNDLREYDLIIQCGGCMFNRRFVLSRVNRAKEQSVPMTNYGVTIAQLTGILDDISYS